VEETAPAPACRSCGKPGAPVCLDCFMGRPFDRDIICNVCGEEKPIVRLYLNGPACDDCNAARTKGWRA
jgi:hypothetical protein